MNVSVSQFIGIAEFVFSAGTIVFLIYNYFRNPQIKSERFEALFSQRLESFQKELVNLRDNHIHTLDTKIDSVTTDVNRMENQITKLTTIIDERIPRGKQ